jgi:hypothetical protein
VPLAERYRFGPGQSIRFVVANGSSRCVSNTGRERIAAADVSPAGVSIRTGGSTTGRCCAHAVSAMNRKAYDFTFERHCLRKDSQAVLSY